MDAYIRVHVVLGEMLKGSESVLRFLQHVWEEERSTE